MSEEEIIYVIEKVLSNKEIGLLEATDTFYQAIQGLLNLYNKEKEKNRLLIEGKFREVADKNSYIKDNYISKDKIREKIEELKEILNKGLKENEGYYTDETIVYDEQIQVLQELLQEGDKYECR